MTLIATNPKPFHRIDLDNVPRSAVIEDPVYEQILLELKELFLTLVPEDERAYFAAALQLESEPLVIQLEACAYRELYLRQRQNEAIAALMLADAQGDDLDALAANPPWCIYRLDGEDDARFKRRILLAVASTSSAGSIADYKFYALSADVNLFDVEVISPEPGVVDVYLLEANGAASPVMVDTVMAVLSADDVRPLTDQVRVQPADVQDYQVNARLWLYAGPDKNTVYQYAMSQLKALVKLLFRFGHDIHHSAVIAGLKVSGVQRVELLDWTDRVIESWQAARCVGMNVEVAGLDE